MRSSFTMGTLKSIGNGARSGIFAALARPRETEPEERENGKVARHDSAGLFDQKSRGRPRY